MTWIKFPPRPRVLARRKDRTQVFYKIDDKKTLKMCQSVCTEIAGRLGRLPSKCECNLQRRKSPGLTRVRQASGSFTPLQGRFGILTPCGLHVKRHHQH